MRKLRTLVRFTNNSELVEKLRMLADTLDKGFAREEDVIEIQNIFKNNYIDYTTEIE